MSKTKTHKSSLVTDNNKVKKQDLSRYIIMADDPFGEHRQIYPGDGVDLRQAENLAGGLLAKNVEIVMIVDESGTRL